MVSRFPFIQIGPNSLRSKRSPMLIVALGLILMFVAASCIREEDITLEQRAYQLTSQIMCPVCDGQTIDQSNAQVARDMRQKVDELLAEGSTNAEVKDYFVFRYGESVLAAPEGKGFNQIAYIVPVFIVFGALGIAVIAIRRLRKSTVQFQPPVTTNGNKLSVYLDQVDADLAQSSESISSNKNRPTIRSGEGET